MKILFTQIYRSNLIIENIKDWLHGNILEIGCGTGVMANQMDRAGYYVYGTDIVDNRQIRIPFRLMKKDKLPFDDNEFDVSTFINTLHHIENWRPLFYEALRVSKEVIICDNEPMIGINLLEHLFNLIHYGELSSHWLLRNSQYWMACFKDYEFKKFKGPWWYPNTHYAFKFTQEKLDV